MSEHYGAVADTDEVRAAQVRLGSRSARTRTAPPAAASPSTPEARDPLTDFEREFVAARDGFYLSTVSSTGWPYVQFRGGPPGFVRSPDEHTPAWADLRGNRQYLSTGNIAGDDRVSLFFMDYANRRRLKLLGHARVVRDDPDLLARLTPPGSERIAESAVVIEVAGHDWNCPQHITPRFTAAEWQAISQA